MKNIFMDRNIMDDLKNIKQKELTSDTKLWVNLNIRES